MLKTARKTALAAGAMARRCTVNRQDQVPLRGLDRLKEIDMFFQKRHPVHQTTRRLAKLLQKAGIPYAIVGGMAVNLHGAERTTRDVDVLLTQEGFDRFQQEFIGSAFARMRGRSRRFVDRKNNVTVDVLRAGKFPGSGKPGPIAFPDPANVSVTIDNTRVINLPQLVQLKLAARRYYDFGDVVFLIRVHNLDESFANKLHPSVRRDYLECLDEKRREDEYKKREGVG
jgi:hypothetical protein